MRPWVVDHVRSDVCTRRLWAGEDVPGGPLPSSLVLAAAAEPLAREVYDTGWRPAPSDGPTRDEPARIIRTAVPA